MKLDTMTKIEGVPSRAQMIPGMAYFPGTGPAGTTCGDCKFRGIRRKSSKQKIDTLKNDYVDTYYSSASCAEFKRLTGKYGPSMSPGNPSCKYFQPEKAEEKDERRDGDGGDQQGA